MMPAETDSISNSRYHRQTLLPEIGTDGQLKLAASHAIIVGAGATGGAAAEVLVRAGIGRLTLIDRDLVEATNLQRQTLFDEGSLGEPKAVAGADRLRAVNSTVAVEAIVMDLTARTIDRLPLHDPLPPGGTRLLLDGTDNFETRFLLNDLAVRERLPFVYAGVIGTRGMTMAVRPGRTPCLRCLFDGPPPPGSQPTCDTAGVLGAAVQIIGAGAATQALRIMVGDPPPALLREIDAWTGAATTRDFSETNDPECPCCVLGRFDFLAANFANTAALCGQRAIQISPPHQSANSKYRMDLAALQDRLDPYGSFQHTPFLIRGQFDHEPADEGHTHPTLAFTVFADGRAIVGGTSRIERARAIYTRYIGT